MTRLAVVALLVLALGGCRSVTGPQVSPGSSFVAPTATIRSVKVEVGRTHGTFTIRADGLARADWQVFLNTDNDVTTGYARFGSEYLVDGSQTFGGSAPIIQTQKRSWGPVVGHATFRLKGDRLTVSIPRDVVQWESALGWRVALYLDGALADYEEGETP